MLNDTTNYDVWLEHSSLKLGYRIAKDENGSHQYSESLAPFAAPQIFQGGYSYDSTDATVNVPLAIEDWSGGCGFTYIPGSPTIAKTTYASASGIDASWRNRLTLLPEQQTGATTTQSPVKFVYGTLGTFVMTTRYVYEWASSTWTQRLDVGASLTCTDLIEYSNSNGTYLVLGVDGGAYYHSTDGITWTTFPAGSAPAYRASNSANITSGTSLTVTKPTGTVDNDIMIATVIADNAATITPPAGWTQIASETSTDGRARVYWRRAATEGASYTFTIEGSTTASYQVNGSGHDGWVTSGSSDTTSNYMNVGNISSTKYQAILGFDTSAIPDASTVSAASLDLYHLDTTIIGADIGYYDHGASITNADYNATPSDTSAGTMQQNGNGGHQVYNLSNLSNINKTGTTGFRINFTSAGAYYNQIASYDHTTAGFRPVLNVTYTIDVPATASISSYSGAVTSGTPYDFVDSDYVADTSQTTITSGTGTSTGSNRCVVVTFAATGDDTTVRSWTSSSGTERVDTGGSSYYPAISTYDFTANSGAVATITGTASSAYDSLALGAMICLTPASSGSPQVSVWRWAVRGMASGEPLLWAVNSDGDIRNTSDPTNSSSWSAADTTQMGEPSTINGLEVLNNVFYLFTKKGIISYNGTTVSTVWNNTTLTQESTAARPYTWVDQKIYFTYSGSLYRYDGTDIQKMWPRSYQSENSSRTGTITAITGDERNLYFAIADTTPAYTIMKCNPNIEYTVNDETFMPVFEFTIPSSSATKAMIVLPGASDTLHSTNPQLVAGIGTNAHYFILPRNGKSPDSDSNYKFYNAASASLTGTKYDIGAKLFPKFLNSSTVMVQDASTSYNSTATATCFLLDGTTLTGSNSISGAGIQTTTFSTDIEFTQLRPDYTLQATNATDVVNFTGVVFNCSLNPPRKRIWNVVVEIDEDLELVGGGDSRYSAKTIRDHLFNSLTERVTFYDKDNTSYITRVLAAESVAIGTRKSQYKLTLVQLV